MVLFFIKSSNAEGTFSENLYNNKQGLRFCATDKTSKSNRKLMIFEQVLGTFEIDTQLPPILWDTFAQSIITKNAHLTTEIL